MFNIRKIQEQLIYNAVRESSDEKTACSIVFNGNKESSSEDNVTWVRNTMQRLEDAFDRDKVKAIRMNCQCGYGMEERLILLKQLKDSSDSLQEFAGHEKAQKAGIFYSDGGILLQFSYCPCPMLAQVDRLETDTWCQCTTGYSKFLFEEAFGCKVDVELLKSVKMGDDTCLMKIVPLGQVFIGKQDVQD
jgi:predicted hydrocarbon binding protein